MGKIYINENQILVPQMLEIYKPVEFDWMHTAITKNSVFTIHHIKEANRGGKTTLDNCALLLKKSHRTLNMLESRDYVLYFAWNELFMDINISRQPPSDEHIREMKLLKAKTKKTIYG